MKARKGGFTLVELLIVIMIIAILAGMMLLATGSATDNAEATKVINDLRGAKSASLLYYADHNQWPVGTGGGTVTTSLERYMDRSFDAAKYGTLSVTAEVGDRQLIGFTALGGPAGSQGVRNKLAAKARESGLTNATGGAYVAADTAIYTNMK